MEEALFSSPGPNRGSPFYRKPKQLLREAMSCVFDETARLRPTVRSLLLLVLFLFVFSRMGNLRETSKEKKEAGGSSSVSHVHTAFKHAWPPSINAFGTAKGVAHEKSNHLTLLPDKISKAREKKETVDRKKRNIYIYIQLLEPRRRIARQRLLALLVAEGDVTSPLCRVGKP